MKRDPASAPGVGDRVGFVITKGLQLISRRAEDPKYVEENNMKIDANYYMESQLLPPLERVFESMGITKSELTGIGKQLGLFEAISNKKQMKIEEALSNIEGFICNNCENKYRRVPLQGKCLSCDGEILFYLEDKRSKVFEPWISTQST